MAAEPIIFIVDDDEPVRDSLQLLLESYRLDVRAFASLQEFLAAWTSNQRGCLLLGLRQSTADGYDLTVLKALKAAKDRLAGVPVIVMAGQWDDRSRMRALKAGAYAVLERPIDGDVLIDMVREAWSPRTTARPALVSQT